MDKINESFMRYNTKKQMQKLNKQISVAGGDIGQKSNTDHKNNLQYMDNPFNQKKRHIDTYEHYIKNDAVKKTETDKMNNKKFGKITKLKESIKGDKYEDVVFLQGEEAYEPLRILNNDGEDAALNYLKQWHDYGHHMGSDELGHSNSDDVYKKDNYIMSWNNSLNYIGLQYEFEDTNESTIDEVQVGDTIVCDNMPDDPNPIKKGTKGVVKKVLPDINIIEVNWENGRTLNLDMTVDEFTIINESEIISKKDIKDQTDKEKHDKKLIWKYEDFVINGKNHVNTTKVEDKDRPFYDNTSDEKEFNVLNNKIAKDINKKLNIKEGAIYPKSKLSDKFEMMLHDDLKTLKCGIFYIDEYDLYLNDEKLFKINPDRDSVKSIVKKVKEKCDL